MLATVTSGIIKSLHAGDGKTLLKPSELDIYYEPEEKVRIIGNENQYPTLLHENVSSLRKMITKPFSGLLTTHEKLSKVFTSAEQNVKGIYKQATEDPNSLLVPGSIILATLGGAVVPGRGKRPFKRIFYGTLFGTTAAAVTHPERTLDIATTGYYHTTGGLSSLWHRFTTSSSETITEKVEKDVTLPQVEESEDINQEVSNIDIIDEKEIISELNKDNIENITSDDDIESSLSPDIETVQEKLESIATNDYVIVDEIPNTLETTSADIKEDFGQSDPEDSDMYSTRSS